MSKADVASFRIDMDKLPRKIEEAAFRSGNFPYDKQLKTERYEKELEGLQIELLKMLDWVKAKGERVVIVFEGRDAAGKGGAIARVTQHLNPRYVPIVALPKPDEREAGQWYFQRYVEHMPSKGQICLLYTSRCV